MRKKKKKFWSCWHSISFMAITDLRRWKADANHALWYPLDVKLCTKIIHPFALKLVFCSNCKAGGWHEYGRVKRWKLLDICFSRSPRNLIVKTRQNKSRLNSRSLIFKKSKQWIRREGGVEVTNVMESPHFQSFMRKGIVRKRYILEKTLKPLLVIHKYLSMLYFYQ